MVLIEIHDRYEFQMERIQIRIENMGVVNQ